MLAAWVSRRGARDRTVHQHSQDAVNDGLSLDCGTRANIKSLFLFVFLRFFRGSQSRSSLSMPSHA